MGYGVVSNVSAFSEDIRIPGIYNSYIGAPH
jgi:hypothetical protein